MSFADIAMESRFIVLVSGLLLVGLIVELHRLLELWPFSPVQWGQLILHPCKRMAGGHVRISTSQGSGADCRFTSG